MLDAIGQLILLLEQFILLIGTPGLTLALFIETFMPPLPAQLMIPFAGILVGMGEMRFINVLIAAVVGETLGSVALYLVAARYGEEQVRAIVRWTARWVPITERHLDNARNRFVRHGPMMVFLARVTPMPIVRTIVCLVAGYSAMNLLSFTLLTLSGSTVSVVLLLMAGIYLGDNWQAALTAFVQQPLLWIGLGVAVIVALLGYRRFVFTRRRDATQIKQEAAPPRAKEPPLA
jgi:membrane protein DedA with SNARE-associated domain